MAALVQEEIALWTEVLLAREPELCPGTALPELPPEAPTDEGWTTEPRLDGPKAEAELPAGMPDAEDAPVPELAPGPLVAELAGWAEPLACAEALPFEMPLGVEVPLGVPDVLLGLPEV